MSKDDSESMKDSNQNYDPFMNESLQNKISSEIEKNIKKSIHKEKIEKITKPR